jgi:histidinol phosphatase-like enzyme
MGAQEHPLLIVSCKVLLQAEMSPHGPALFRRLAKLTREGTRLLVTASEPDQWFPTRGKEDSVLRTQGRLQDRLQEVGGDFDGIYYIPRSVFTQDRKRTTALRDILSRYQTEAGNARLVSQSRAFIKAAERLEIPILALSKDEAAIEQLLEALDATE